MNKILILTVVAFLSTFSLGQELYKPFLEEGKVWTYHYYNDMTGREFYESLSVRGDTIIDNKSYKSISNVDTDAYCFALREEGHKVFVVWPQYPGESLLYDFGLNEGDIFPLDGDGEDSAPTSWATVVSVDTVIVGNHAFRILDVRPTGDMWPNWWVEGIGGMQYLTASFQLTGNSYSFLSCKIDGETLLRSADLQTVNVGALLYIQMRSAITDLHGRRLATPPAKGVYIENGRKKIK